MPLSVSISTMGVGAMVMLSLSFHMWDEDLPVWSHLCAVMAGIAIGIAFIAAFSSPDAVPLAYA